MHAVLPAPLEVTMRAYSCILLVIAFTACKPTTPSAAEFARAFASYDRLEDPEAHAAKTDGFTRRWKNARYVWDGLALATLCNDGTRTCAINFWAKALPEDRERLGGLYPRVVFTAEGYAKLRAGCSDATACALRVDGVMSELVADGDMPLAVTFTGADVVRAAPEPDIDGWFPKPVRSVAQAPATREPKEVATDVALAMTPIDRPGAANLTRAQQSLARLRYQRDAYVDIGNGWLKLARVTADEGFVTHAAAAARLALDRAPLHGPALAILAASQLSAHDFAAARATAERVLAATPGDPHALSVAADAALELADVDGAARHVERLVAEGRTLASLSRAAHIAFLRGDKKSARATYDEALAVASPAEPEAVAWVKKERDALGLP